MRPETSQPKIVKVTSGSREFMGGEVGTLIDMLNLALRSVIVNMMPSVRKLIHSIGWCAGEALRASEW
jgi:hypothetical protein